METTLTTPLTETTPQQLGDRIVERCCRRAPHAADEAAQIHPRPVALQRGVSGVFELPLVLGESSLVDSARAGTPAPRQAHPGLQRGRTGRQRNLRISARD